MKLNLLLAITFTILLFPSLYTQTKEPETRMANELKILNEPFTMPLEYFDYTGNPDHIAPGRFTPPAPAVIDSNLSAQLQNVLDEAITEYDIKGLSAALSTPNGDIWKGASGISHDTVELTTDMLFGIGSITKNFIATIIMQLYEADSLKLSDSIYRWLPHFDNIDSTVTIRQLLNHTSGIYNYTNNPLISDSIFVPGSRIWTPEEILKKFVLSPSFPAGTNWEYSNTNYIILGLIIEEITGNEVVTELHNRLTTPLGLNSTFLFPDEGYEGIRSHVWVPYEDTVFDVTDIVDTTFFSAAWTAGAIFSTAGDLVKWSKGLNEGEILNDTTLALMKVPAPYSGGYYGLGTQIAPFYTKWVYGHTGDVIYNSMMFYIPGDSITIAVITNQRFAPINDIWIALYFAYVEVVTSETEHKEPVTVQVFPNPGATQVKFSFELEKPERVKLTVYNQLGQLVKSFPKRIKTSGKHMVKWNVSGMPPGLYTFSLETGGDISFGKLIISK
jgi:D-alanyl-D-alanine carboxypeptidase